MTLIQISDWKKYLQDGEQFLQTARAAHQKSSPAFSRETLYNVICMGIEKLIMAFLMKNGDLAENHTMEDLLRAVEKHLEPDASIREKLLYLHSFQEICDLESYIIRKPTESDTVKFIEIADDVLRYLSPHLHQHPIN